MALSIKQKQVLGVTSIVALVVINLSLLHLTTFGDLLLRQNEERANALSESVFHRVQDVVTSHETAFDDLRGDTELQSVLESAILLKNVTYAAIVDRDGLIVAHSDRARMGERLPDATDLPALVKQDRLTQLWTIYTSNRTLELRRGIAPPEPGAADIGEVRVGISPLLLRAELNESLRPAALTALFALVAALLVAVLLSNVVLRPIH